MKIRNKQTGQIFEVVAGTLYPNFFEEVTDEESSIDAIKVGEPKVEFEIETPKAEPKPKKPAKKTVSKMETTTKKKGAKKNGNTKRN